MKVTWQESDIKAGLQVGLNSSSGSQTMLYQQHDDGVRYCLTLAHHSVSRSMTRAEMVDYLNERRYQPVAVLAL